MCKSKIVFYLANHPTSFFTVPKNLLSIAFIISSLSRMFSLNFCVKFSVYILTFIVSLSSFSSASEEQKYLTQSYFYKFGDIEKSLEFLIGREVGHAGQIVKSRAGETPCFFEIEDTDNVVVCEHRESPDSCKCNIWHWFVVFELHEGIITAVNVQKDLNGIDLIKNIPAEQIKSFRFRYYDQRTIATLALLKKHPVGTSSQSLFKTLEESGAVFRNVRASEEGDIYYYYRARKLYDLNGWRVSILVKSNKIQKILISRDKRIF